VASPGRIAALAGIDPNNPTHFAPPPFDDALRRFYRDDHLQPWFAQGRTSQGLALAVGRVA